MTRTAGKSQLSFHLHTFNETCIVSYHVYKVVKFSEHISKLFCNGMRNQAFGI